MSPLEGLAKELDEKHEEKIVKFVSDIRNGKIDGSKNLALTTLSLLEQIISESENATALELSGAVRGVGRRLGRALPQQLVAANVVRRVLRAIRDEHRAMADQSVVGAGAGAGASAGAGAGAEGAGDSLQRLVLAAAARRATLAAAQPDLREPLREHIAEMRTEIESSASSISAMAPAHVHAAELLLTLGGGRLVERFLRAARARTHYRLLLAEADAKASQALARRLAAAGVPVTVVPHECVAALMSRVNKVVLGVAAVLAGGGCLARAGSHAVTIAAKHYSVPVIALAPLYKLSPMHAAAPARRQLSAEDAPHQALPYQAGGRVVAPRFDLLPPDHVTLFLTSLGGSSPSYIYRLMSELYDPNDHEL